MFHWAWNASGLFLSLIGTFRVLFCSFSLLFHVSSVGRYVGCWCSTRKMNLLEQPLNFHEKKENSSMFHAKNEPPPTAFEFSREKGKQFNVSRENDGRNEELCNETVTGIISKIK